MDESNTTFSNLGQALAELSGRMAAIERSQEALLAGQARERDTQRQTMALMAQLLEHQMAVLKRIEEKTEAIQQATRRQTVVKGKVVIAKPTAFKPSSQPEAEPLPLPEASTLPKPLSATPPPMGMPTPKMLIEDSLAEDSQPDMLPLVEPEIEQQISQALGNISAMLKKKEPRRRKS
ncbi:MAG: hypothetical protein HQL45_12385 [Alphaproteobacteria bacterium]|nr:hypothetical protein [Alphaproteobacteria bacterium]